MEYTQPMSLTLLIRQRIPFLLIMIFWLTGFVSICFRLRELYRVYRFFLQERIPVDSNREKFIEFIPDGVFSITNNAAEPKKTLLFFLEVDMGTETIASMDRNFKDVRQKIINYQALFHSGCYKRYERVFDIKLNGFRLLFLANTPVRFIALCRLAKAMPPSDFVWLTDQERMFSGGVSADIWARGGRHDEPLQSILGPKLSRKATVVDCIR